MGSYDRSSLSRTPAEPGEGVPSREPPRCAAAAAAVPPGALPAGPAGAPGDACSGPAAGSALPGCPLRSTPLPAMLPLLPTRPMLPAAEPGPDGAAGTDRATPAAAGALTATCCTARCCCCCCSRRMRAEVRWWACTASWNSKEWPTAMRARALATSALRDEGSANRCVSLPTQGSKGRHKRGPARQPVPQRQPTHNCER